ncbi:McrB family protein [Fictibacillus terranigra]|uniref:AAA+ ATPase domain-containing protein n=1 Tax=Fictibacillus terranigra TaxID=3058424 RepID=A0ABT8EAI2_9BACL|nr:hypothetical protein [Fictibacillus sp. CENA-BCM004]MDN4074928.1 hypothetical protein [Fictibacillus sp. CENA-BCM004]
MLTKLKTSRTKHGIIRIISIIKDGKLKNYMENEATTNVIDPSQLKGILGIKKLDDPLPSFWFEIQKYPNMVGYFCALAVIFSHHRNIEVFKNSSSNMKGVMHKQDFDEKSFTNLRGILTSSGASRIEDARADEVPYNFSKVFSHGEIGVLVKNLILNRLNTIGWSENAEDSEFKRSFLEQCIWYGFHKVFGLTESQLESWFSGNSLVPENYSKENINYNKYIPIDTHILASLSSKQLIIITGPSGTGKTYGIRRLAASLNPYYNIDRNYNLAFIPIEAGWKDGRHLIGYKNPFSESGEQYETTPLINLLLKASSAQNSDLPFFIIFDEMNLSHVEMYFARFLSLIETAKHPKLLSEPLLSVEDLLLLKKTFKYSYTYISLINEAIENGGLYIPKNVYFIGTVNIDETTYMFSPKVLDRAFVIEKNTDKPSTIFNEEENSKYQSTIPLEKAYKLFLSELSSDNIQKELIDFLDDVYEILKNNFPFGYRVIRECNDYYNVLNNFKRQLDDVPEWLNKNNINNIIFDEILMQKILPKIHGNRKQLATLLPKLVEFCKANGEVIYPRSFHKLKSMERNLQNSGYCGFVV